jgi:hypothetical protein
MAARFSDVLAIRYLVTAYLSLKEAAHSSLRVRSRWHKQAPVCAESLDRIEQTRSLPGFLFSKRTLRINNRKYHGAQIFFDIMVCHIVFIISAASECALALD